jgi:F0F1-type ATP synthase assembly protein I
LVKKQDKPMNKFAQLSGLGIQMGAIIGLFAWLGTYLDEKYQLKTPWWTIVLSLFGVFAGLYLIIREVIKMSKDDESK